MADVLIIFGSKSDSQVYEKIARQLKSDEIGYELRICSAHRTPEMLDQILEKTDAKIIIAGAGLAAHLPGVVASKTTKPVIGVPCNSNFSGLDSLFSIIQMPPGIPVLSVGVNNAIGATTYAKRLLGDYDGVNITGEVESMAVKKAVEILDMLGINITFSTGFDWMSINLNFMELGKTEENEYLVINVPAVEKNSAQDSIGLLEATRSGLWVGLNRGDNAALAAAAILGNHKGIKKYRKEMEKKVKEDDKSIR